MKKITKLINGSIVVFVICLIAVLTLTSCDNTNNNLRKGQDTNITELQGDEYQVTEKEFKSANSFEGVEYLKETILTYKLDGEIEKDKVTNIFESKSHDELEQHHRDRVYSDILDNYYDSLVYSKSEYKLTYVQDFDSYKSTYNITIKYKNKKLIYFFVAISYTNKDIVDCSMINLEY